MYLSIYLYIYIDIYIIIYIYMDILKHVNLNLQPLAFNRQNPRAKLLGPVHWKDTGILRRLKQRNGWSTEPEPTKNWWLTQEIWELHHQTFRSIHPTMGQFHHVGAFMAA